MKSYISLLIVLFLVTSAATALYVFDVDIFSEILRKTDQTTPRVSSAVNRIKNCGDTCDLSNIYQNVTDFIEQNEDMSDFEYNGYHYELITDNRFAAYFCSGRFATESVKSIIMYDKQLSNASRLPWRFGSCENVKLSPNGEYIMVNLPQELIVFRTYNLGFIVGDFQLKDGESYGYVTEIPSFIGVARWVDNSTIYSDIYKEEKVNSTKLPEKIREFKASVTFNIY